MTSHLIRNTSIGAVSIFGVGALSFFTKPSNKSFNKYFGEGYKDFTEETNMFDYGCVTNKDYIFFRRVSIKSCDDDICAGEQCYLGMFGQWFKLKWQSYF